MSAELRFDGRVAIVTGAGGNPSLGRAYARLLASRGAKVLVNDLGVGPDGRGVTPASAQAVADEIVGAGGEALSDGNSVAEERSAQAIIQAALEAWGRVDILVNNAGVAILAEFDEISSSDIAKIVDVHLMGTIWMCRAAWPHMREAAYGRIVNISSGTVLGGPYTSIYGATKAGILGLTRSLAISGSECNVKVNAVLPAAGTNATLLLNEDSDWVRTAMRDWTPEKVAQAVALLAHESCPVSGAYLNVGAGRVSELYFAQTRGYSDLALTPELLLDRFDEVVDREGATPVPGALDEATLSRVAYRPKPYAPA